MTEAIAHKQKTPLERLKHSLETRSEEIQLALPEGDAARFIRVAVTTIMQKPELMAKDQQSLVLSLMSAAQLGLSVDPLLGEAHLVPFKDKVQMIPGYKGFVRLIRRSGKVSNFHADVVRESDTFEYYHGTNNFLQHRPTDFDPKTRGDIIGAYAVVNYQGGGCDFEVMPIIDIIGIRDRSQGYRSAVQRGGSNPWMTDFAEMAKKTVIRRLAKTADWSIEVQLATFMDEAPDAGKVTHIEGQQIVVDADYSEPEPTSVEDTKSALDKVVDAAGGPEKAEEPQEAQGEGETEKASEPPASEEDGPPWKVMPKAAIGRIKKACVDLGVDYDRLRYAISEKYSDEYGTGELTELPALLETEIMAMARKQPKASKG